MTKSWFRLPGSAVLLSSFFVDKGFNLLDKYRQSRGFFCQIPELSLQVSMDAIIAGQARPGQAGRPQILSTETWARKGSGQSFTEYYTRGLYSCSERAWRDTSGMIVVWEFYIHHKDLFPKWATPHVRKCVLMLVSPGDTNPPHWCQVIPIMIFWCIIVPVTREPVLDIIRGGGDHNNIRTEAHTSINRQPIRE